MSVARCMQEIDSAEFAEWQAFYKLNPFGEIRTDLNFAVLISSLLNGQGVKKQSGGNWEASDFMLDFTPKEAKQQTAAEMKANLLAAFHKKPNKKR